MGCVQFKVVWPWTPVLPRFWNLLHSAANSISSRNLSTLLLAKWSLRPCLLPGGVFLGHRMLKNSNLATFPPARLRQVVKDRRWGVWADQPWLSLPEPPAAFKGREGRLIARTSAGLACDGRVLGNQLGMPDARSP